MALIAYNAVIFQLKSNLHYFKLYLALHKQTVLTVA